MKCAKQELFDPNHSYLSLIGFEKGLVNQQTSSHGLVDGVISRGWMIRKPNQIIFNKHTPNNPIFSSKKLFQTYSPKKTLTFIPNSKSINHDQKQEKQSG
jgi:hypothetical protein